MHLAQVPEYPSNCPCLPPFGLPQARHSPAIERSSGLRKQNQASDLQTLERRKERDSDISFSWKCYSYHLAGWAGGPHLSVPPLKWVPHISLLRCGFAGCRESIGGWWGDRLFGGRSNGILFLRCRLLLSRSGGSWTMPSGLAGRRAPA